MKKIKYKCDRCGVESFNKIIDKSKHRGNNCSRFEQYELTDIKKLYSKPFVILVQREHSSIRGEPIKYWFHYSNYKTQNDAIIAREDFFKSHNFLDIKIINKRRKRVNAVEANLCRKADGINLTLNDYKREHRCSKYGYAIKN